MAKLRLLKDDTKNLSLVSQNIRNGLSIDALSEKVKKQEFRNSGIADRFQAIIDRIERYASDKGCGIANNQYSLSLYKEANEVYNKYLKGIKSSKDILDAMHREKPISDKIPKDKQVLMSKLYELKSDETFEKVSRYKKVLDKLFEAAAKQPNNKKLLEAENLEAEVAQA